MKKVNRKIIGSIFDDGNLKTMSQRLTFAFIPPVYMNGKWLNLKFELKLENISKSNSNIMERITFRTEEGRKIAQIIQNAVASFILYQTLIKNNKEAIEHALIYNIRAGIDLANKKINEWGIGKQATLPVEEI